MNDSGDRKMRFALVGAGNVAVKYVDAFKNIDDAEIVGAIARNQDKLRIFANEHRIVHCAADIPALLDLTEIDAVILCTPSGIHAECAIKAAALGKHVLCEKPLDITLEKIDSMTKACRSAGVKLGCTYQHRTAEHNRIVHDMVQSGARKTTTKAPSGGVHGTSTAADRSCNKPPIPSISSYG